MKTDYGLVSIPRFKFSHSANLKEYMYKLGMKTAFSEESDFSGITDVVRLKIDAASQKAYISVTEEGTEAAAVTELRTGFFGSRPTKEKFRFKANKPFIFLIREKKTGLILFMGKLTNP